VELRTAVAAVDGDCTGVAHDYRTAVAVGFAELVAVREERRSLDWSAGSIGLEASLVACPRRSAPLGFASMGCCYVSSGEVERLVAGSSSLGRTCWRVCLSFKLVVLLSLAIPGRCLRCLYVVPNNAYVGCLLSLAT
jgi:hypothetical protein